MLKRSVYDRYICISETETISQRHIFVSVRILFELTSVAIWQVTGQSFQNTK